MNTVENVFCIARVKSKVRGRIMARCGARASCDRRMGGRKCVDVVRLKLETRKSRKNSEYILYQSVCRTSL